MTLPLRARAHLRALALALTLALSLFACGSGADDGAATADSDSRSGINATELPGGEDASEEGAAADAGSTDEGFDVEDWDSVLAAADGQTVNWYMFGADEDLNAYVNGYVADELAELGVTLNQVKVGDTVEAVNTVLAEQQAGADTDGAVDAIWINGENFLTGQQADLWYCGWNEALPNAELIDYERQVIAEDFGIPIEGCEAAWNLSQSAIVYDAAKLDPLTDIDALVQWMADNPGRFTYPAPPDFTGSMATRHFIYAAAGGVEEFPPELDEAQLEELAQPGLDLLNEVEPDLWRGGETYPQSQTEVEELYANGEIDLYFTYGVGGVNAQIEDGVFPATTDSFIFESGMLGNANYISIPYNSPNKAAALVLANVLESPEAQLEKAEVLGYAPAIDPERTDLADEFAELTDVKNSGLEFAESSFGDLNGEWLTAFEEAWTEQVLQQ